MSKSQTKCKEAAEKILGITFIENYRPDFLCSSESGCNLECLEN